MDFSSHIKFYANLIIYFELFKLNNSAKKVNLAPGPVDLRSDGQTRVYSYWGIKIGRTLLFSSCGERQLRADGATVMGWGGDLVGKMWGFTHFYMEKCGDLHIFLTCYFLEREIIPKFAVDAS